MASQGGMSAVLSSKLAYRRMALAASSAKLSEPSTSAEGSPSASSSLPMKPPELQESRMITFLRARIGAKASTSWSSL